MPKRYRILLAPVVGVILCLLVSFIGSEAADTPHNILLKSHRINPSPFRLQENRSNDEIWDAFMLVEKANSGDVPAMHELGLRYLMGRNFSADTVKAAYWIGKAAAKNLWPAQYNYALMLNNGWGVPWNPFEAFRLVKSAAFHHITEAEYMYGIFLVENLVIPSDYATAYKWISMAADSGFSPAIEVKKEFAQRGILAKINKGKKDTGEQSTPGQSQPAGPQNPAMQPVILDISDDTTPQPDDSILLNEAIRQRSYSADPTTETDTSSRLDASQVRLLEAEAAAGSPEALTVLGRLYEQGTGIHRDRIRAALYYIRAIRFDSPRSPMLLWNMIRANDEFYPELKNRVDNGDPAAAFIWSGLTDFGFDNQLTPSQALGLLVASSEREFPEALVQLGLCYYSGHWVRQDRERALSLLRDAQRRGSREATIRLAAIGVENDLNSSDVGALIDSLKLAASDGSVLAQAVLGYCYQTGRGVGQDTARAVEWYRLAWQRGSRAAISALRGMYDDLRPTDAEYRILD